MGRIDLSGLDGLRRPTSEEVYKITRYYEHFDLLSWRGV